MNAPLSLCWTVLYALPLHAGQVKGPAPAAGPTLRQAFTRAYAALPAQWQSAAASFLKSPSYDAAALELAFGRPASPASAAASQTRKLQLPQSRLKPQEADRALDEFLATAEKEASPRTAAALGLLQGVLQGAFTQAEGQESLRQAYEAAKQPLGALSGSQIEEMVERETASWRGPIPAEELFQGKARSGEGAAPVLAAGLASNAGSSNKIVIPLTKPEAGAAKPAKTPAVDRAMRRGLETSDFGGRAAKLVNFDRRTEPRDAMVGRILEALKPYAPEISSGRFEEIFIFTPDFALGDPQTHLPKDKQAPHWKRLSEPLIQALKKEYGEEAGAALWARLSELNRAMDDHDAVYQYGETAAAKTLAWMKQNAAKVNSRATVIIDHDNPDTFLSALALRYPEVALRHEKLVTEIARMWDHNMTPSDLETLFLGGAGNSLQWRAQVAGTIAMVRSYDQKAPFSEVLEALPGILDDVAAGRTELYNEWQEPMASLKEQYEHPERFVEAKTPNVFVVRSKEDGAPMDVVAFVLYNSPAPYVAGLKILIHYWPDKPGLTFNPVGANTAKFPGLDLNPLKERLGRLEAQRRGVAELAGNWGGKKDVMGSVMDSKSVFSLPELGKEIQSFLDEQGPKP